MIHKSKDGFSWLEFELLAEEKLKHGVILRKGDVSITHCRDAVKAVLDIPFLVSGVQCHGKDVKKVETHEDMPTCDALATSTANLGLTIFHADCQAGIIYDPVNHAVSNVHSGWRGSVQNIYAETITFMKSAFGSDPKNLLAAISPSLGPDKAEFVNYRTELPEHFWKFQTKPNYFNFWAITEWQLACCGLLPHHIQIAGMCTHSDPAHFFSYRRDRTEARNATIVALTGYSQG